MILVITEAFWIKGQADLKSNQDVDPISVQNIMILIAYSNGYRMLPFLWIFGRKFWTVSLYGANVFVENVMGGLEQPEKILLRVNSSYPFQIIRMIADS